MNYKKGAVWIDTIYGEPGDEIHFNGIYGRPVNNLTDAFAIALALDISRFEVVGQSYIVFTEPHIGEVWHGDNWMLNIGGRNISGTTIIGAKLCGSLTGEGAIFKNCVSIPQG